MHRGRISLLQLTNTRTLQLIELHMSAVENKESLFRQLVMTEGTDMPTEITLLVLLYDLTFLNGDGNENRACPYRLQV